MTITVDWGLKIQPILLFIFSYNLSETIESIKTSLSYQPVQTVMTREMELEYDRKLIEDIKQTSLDMVGHLAPLQEVT